MIIFSIMIALSMSFGACGVEKEDLKVIYDEANNQQEEVKEADRVCDLGYFIGLGMMEIHYAYV